MECVNVIISYHCRCMIHYYSHKLDNGLELLIIPDNTVKTAVINLAYNVGARDESPDKTGFAHLFEHLMFGGSQNIPEYDTPLQRVGGENNAFTTSDYTNYYLSLPSQNIETGFWLESDRMLSLSFEQSVLDIQKKVVIEEFKQRYLNKPYGDVWHKLRPVAYKSHPYRWPVIGEKIDHIENAELQSVKDFFFNHYNPDNAVLVVGGDVKQDNIVRLAEKWFGEIKRKTSYVRDLPQEPEQKQKRKLEIEAEVPQNALFMVFHIPGRQSKEYHSADLLSDVLGRGKSSKLYHQLVKKETLFTSIGASITGTMDPGLLVVQGYLKEGVSFEEAEKAVRSVIDEVMTMEIEDEVYNKVINQALSSHAFSRVEVLDKCMGLAHAWLRGDSEEVNRETDYIRGVTKNDLRQAASRYLGEENSTVMYYSKKKVSA